MPPASPASCVSAAALARTDLSLPQWRIRRWSPQQRLELLVAHRRPRGRLEAHEHLLEGRPAGVDQAVLEPGAEDPQRHLREVAVVADGARSSSADFGTRQALDQGLHAARALARALLDRLERNHQRHRAGA